MDTKLFLFLNFDGGTFLDQVMHILSERNTFFVIAFFMLFMFYRQMSFKRFIAAFFYAGLVILLADQTATILKHNIPFFRPTHTPGLEGLIHTVNGYTGGLYGTVSGHASNSFGLAVYASLIIRKRWVTAIFFTFAVLTTYSRIYLGVHFPSQIIYGIIVGCLAGYISYWLFNRACRRVK